MIKNERQYRLTKAHVRAFADGIAEIKNRGVPAGIDPLLSEIQQRAMESQLEEMNSEVNEYEALKAGKVTSFETDSLIELPTLFVKARIARGLTHKDLALRLSVKEQQVQRWEANDFSNASIKTLRALADALGVVLRQQLFVPTPQLNPGAFLDFMSTIGLSPDFVLKRLVTPRIASLLRDGTAGLKEIVSTAGAISRVFGFEITDLLEMRSPRLDLPAIAGLRFKLPARTNPRVVSAFTVYAHYLSALLVDCDTGETVRNLPTDFHQFHRAVTAPDKPLTFDGVIEYLWNCGIIVLPLRDAGGFHGAVWKIKGKFVIALKQRTQLESRWLYDALHELGHVVNGDVTDDVTFIEESEISPDAKETLEEKANEWAENALFDGRSDEIEEACTKACGGQMKRLKDALPRVAEAFNVRLGSLANHMAFRLGEQSENWWGAATNLQIGNRPPFGLAREVLWRHVNLLRLNSFDRELLEKALSEEVDYVQTTETTKN